MSDDIRVPHSPSLAFTGELTVNVWYRQGAFNLWAGPVGKNWGFDISVDGGGGGRYIIYYLHDALNDFVNIYVEGATVLGNMRVVTIRRRDGDTLPNKLYVNGVLVDETAVYAADTFSSGVSDLLIAQTSGASMPGFVASLQVYNRALSDGAVAVGERAGGELLRSLMEYHNPPRVGLVCWLPMEEGAGGITLDRSGNGNDGTLEPVVSPPDWIRNKKWQLRAEARF